MRGSSRRPRVVALGLWLLWRQPATIASLVLAGLGAIAAGAFSVHAPPGPTVGAPVLTAVVAAWSVGIMLAFSGALHAIPSDAKQGIIALACARGVRMRAYALGRMVALTITIGLGIAAITLAASICTISVSSSVLPALRATCGALAYCVVFAATIGPLALATLGQSSRAAGYLWFLAVLVVPELAASWTAAILPSGWHELTSIPAALDAVRAGVESPHSQGLHAARALAVLGALVAMSWAVVTSRTAHALARWYA